MRPDDAVSVGVERAFSSDGGRRLFGPVPGSASNFEQTDMVDLQLPAGDDFLPPCPHHFAKIGRWFGTSPRLSLDSHVASLLRDPFPASVIRIRSLAHAQKGMRRRLAFGLRDF